MSRERHSEAWEDINPTIFGKGKKPNQPPRIVTKKVAAKLFAEMRAAVNIENHMKALRE